MNSEGTSNVERAKTKLPPQKREEDSFNLKKKVSNMALVSYSCAAPSPGIVALEVLAKLQGVEVTFSSGDSPSLEVETIHPITGSNTTKSVAWIGCARTLSNLIPSLALWEGAEVESWVESASNTLIPTLESGDKIIVENFIGKLESHLSSAYLTGSFSAADVCVSLWLGLAMQKCELTTLPEKTSSWMTSILSAIQSYATDTVEAITTSLAGEAAAPAATGEFADNALVQKLVEFGLEYEVYSHAACMTADELVANVPLASEKETHTKNLFFKDKKHGMFLVSHATSTTFNTKQLGKLLKLQGKVNMRLADATLLDKHLKAEPGHVGPLCIANDESKEVTLVLDKALTDYDFVHSHPAKNDASVKLAPSVLLDFMTKAGVEPIVLDFSAEGGDAGAQAPPAQSKKPKQDKSKQQQKQKQNQNKKTAKKGDTLLALQWKKDENFAMWYSDVIVLSEMISYYDISGCYILRPWSYKIWDLIQNWFNEKVSSNNFVSTIFEECYSTLTYIHCFVDFGIGS